MYEFKPAEVIARISEQAEVEGIKEFEEKNYEMLKDIYGKVVEVAKKGDWELCIKKADDYFHVNQDKLELYLESKGFDVCRTCDSMVISWFLPDDEDWA